MKNAFLIFFGLYLSICFASCKNLVDKDVQTKVTGYVMDELKSIRLANINITIYGLKTTLIQGVQVDSIGTVKTNANGEFQYTINADGRHNGYRLEVNDYQKYISYETYAVEPGENNAVVIKLRERTNVFYKLKIQQTTANSILVSDGHRYHYLPGKSIDTTLIFKALPNANNHISVQAKYANNTRIYSQVYFIRTRDTTVVETIANTDLLQLMK